VEILRLILRWDVSMCRLDKNSLLPLRLTCKAFDNVLRPYLMKTIKMEYSCFLRDTKYNVRTLERVGNLCDSIYLDMMVIRDEGRLQPCRHTQCLFQLRAVLRLQTQLNVYSVIAMLQQMVCPCCARNRLIAKYRRNISPDRHL
jgi:hypothetical protein